MRKVSCFNKKLLFCNNKSHYKVISSDTEQIGFVCYSNTLLPVTMEKKSISPPPHLSMVVKGTASCLWQDLIEAAIAAVFSSDCATAHLSQHCWSPNYRKWWESKNTHFFIHIQYILQYFLQVVVNRGFITVFMPKRNNSIKQLTDDWCVALTFMQHFYVYIPTCCCNWACFVCLWQVARIRFSKCHIKWYHNHTGDKLLHFFHRSGIKHMK